MTTRVMSPKPGRAGAALTVLDQLVCDPRYGVPVKLLANRLALIAPQASEIELAIRPGFPLLRALGDGRLAVADPAHVPAGLYARQALTALGVWEGIAPKTARAGDVRGALALVARVRAEW